MTCAITGAFYWHGNSSGITYNSNYNNLNYYSITKTIVYHLKSYDSEIMKKSPPWGERVQCIGRTVWTHTVHIRYRVITRHMGNHVMTSDLSRARMPQTDIPMSLPSRTTGLLPQIYHLPYCVRDISIRKIAR